MSIGIMLGGELPEVVKTVLDGLMVTDRFQDFRIIGNQNGTTLVLRYTRLDTDGQVRHSPLWQHRSNVNVTRDHIKLNSWIKDHSTPITETPQWNVNAPSFEPSSVINMVDKSVNSRNMDTQTEELESNKTPKGIQTEWDTITTTTKETQTELELK